MSLLDFWFSPHNERLWFNSTPSDDLDISILFSTDIDSLNNIFLSEKSIKELLEIIILSDQIPRHVHRNNQVEIAKYHEIALKTAKYVIKSNLDKRPELCDKERCFILLPFRHTFKEKYVRFSIERINEYIAIYGTSPYYARFLKSSLYSLSKIVTDNLGVEEIDTKISMESIVTILDNNSCNNLEKITYIRGVGLKACDKERNNIFYEAFMKIVRKKNSSPKYDTVVISISGGVDSMVCSYVLHHLAKRFKFQVIGVMIDYGNRDTCLLEVEFVKRWCRLLDIPLYVRHIDYLRRDRSNMRDDYEIITKECRFDLYRKFSGPIVLGHNLDDCVENIFTNIRKGRLDNLRGMKYKCTEKLCTLLRPMLNISKSEIIKFAHVNKIPYLEDSTPKWSDRGKIRDNLVPFLNSFDSNIIPGLILLADNSLKINKIFEENVIEKFYSSRSVTETLGETIITFPITNKEHKYGYLFWKNILRKIQSPSHPISNKSIKTMANSICKNKKNSIKIKLDEFYTCEVRSTTFIIKFNRQ